MSSASNLGYGNQIPFGDVNPKYASTDNSNAPIGFTNTIAPGCPGLVGIKDNVLAASASVLKGGAKKHLKRKINNITKKYRMRHSKRKIKTMKSRIRSKYTKRRHTRTKSRRHHKSKRGRYTRQRGGYSQYQNNLPMTPTYSVGAVNLPASQLALANPPPIQVLGNCTNCTDNYNHFTGKGFESRGH
jgi:hypothetical protein